MFVYKELTPNDTIIISLFNVDAKNKVKNYNKKEIIVYIINYNI